MSGRRRVVGVVLASACASGCSSTPGVRIGDITLQQFEAGETRRSTVVAVLGEPTSAGVVADAPEIEVLRYSTVENTSGGLASLFLGSGRRNTATVYFVIVDGVVERFWADREPERTILGTRLENERGATPSAGGGGG